MKKGTWRKHHKWLGLGMTFFLLMFCMSGILLNHRQLIKEVNVSRKYLPSRYEFKNWNGGLLRGTLDIGNTSTFVSHQITDSSHTILLYGNGGIWLTDSKASFFKDFNKGLPTGADLRQIRNVVNIESDGYGSNLFAVSPFALYRYSNHGAWKEIKVPLGENEKFTDITSHGDTLVVLSRSFIYTSLPPYDSFSRIEIHAPSDFVGKVSDFFSFFLLLLG